MSLLASVDVILSTAAANEVYYGSARHAATDDPTDPDVKLCERKRGAEDVEQRLHPERLDEGAVLHNVFLSEQDAQEEKAEEPIVSIDYDSIEAVLIFTDSKDGVHYCENAKSDATRVHKRSASVRQASDGLSLGAQAPLRI